MSETKKYVKVINWVPLNSLAFQFWIVIILTEILRKLAGQVLTKWDVFNVVLFGAAWVYTLVMRIITGSFVRYREVTTKCQK